MAFADTSRIALGITEETTWGTWPGGNLEEVRFSDESFGHQQDTTNSNEIRADRQVPDIIRTSISAQGGYNGEISYGVTAFELFLKGLLGAASDFGTPPTEITQQFNATASSNEFDDNSTGVDLSGLSVGDWIRTTGFSNDANNGYFQITAIDTVSTPQTITVAGATLVDETGSGDETVQGSAVMRNGTTKHSFALEKQYQDLAMAARVLGYRVGGMTLTLNPQEIATYGWTGQGKQITDTAGTDLTNTGNTLDFSTLATLNSAAANNVMNTVDGIGELIINRDDPLTNVTVQSMSANPQNDLRKQNALTSGLGPAGVGIGRFNVSGSVSAYFEDKSLLEEYLLFRTTDVAVVTKDGVGNAYLWDFPAIKLGGDGLPKAGGNNQDAIVELDMSAFRSTRDSQDYTMAVHKFSA